jgi:hypothetical protein
MFKRAVITVQPDITAQPPVVMPAPRVTDHKANRWLKRRGRVSRAPCSRFSLPTLVRSSSSSSASHRPQERNQQQAHPQQTTRVVISQPPIRNTFLGTFVCWV